MSTRRPDPTSSPSESAADWAARRSDARRNHERVMAAAREVFAERGADGTIPEIAARAGVGKATVYRSYPTKEALVRAVAADHAEWVDERARQAAEGTDAFEALRGFLVDVFGRLAQDALLLRVLGDARAQREGRRADFELLITRAIEQGTIRADATVFDVSILVGGCARALLDAEVTDPDMWRRYAALILDALRVRAD